MRAALAVLAISLGNLAVGTAGALEADLAGATSGVPRLILALMAWVSGTGVLLLPMLVVVWLSLRRWDLLGPIQYVGLDNWHSVLSDPTFGNSLLVTLVFIALVVPARFRRAALAAALALAFAFSLNRIAVRVRIGANPSA